MFVIVILPLLSLSILDRLLVMRMHNDSSDYNIFCELDEAISVNQRVF